MDEGVVRGHIDEHPEIGQQHGRPWAANRIKEGLQAKEQGEWDDPDRHRHPIGQEDRQHFLWLSQRSQKGIKGHHQKRSATTAQQAEQQSTSQGQSDTSRIARALGLADLKPILPLQRPHRADIRIIRTAVVTPAAASGRVPSGEIIAVSTTPINRAAASPTINGTASLTSGKNSALVDACGVKV